MILGITPINNKIREKQITLYDHVMKILPIELTRRHLCGLMWSRQRVIPLKT